MNKIVEVVDNNNYRLVGTNFRSRDYLAILSRYKKMVVKDPSALSRANQMIKAYNVSREAYKLSKRWSVEGSKGNEYKLMIDKSDHPTKVWYSRHLDNLVYIAFERDLKEAIV